MAEPSTHRVIPFFQDDYSRVSYGSIYTIYTHIVASASRNPLQQGHHVMEVHPERRRRRKRDFFLFPLSFSIVGSQETTRTLMNPRPNYYYPLLLFETKTKEILVFFFSSTLLPVTDSLQGAKGQLFSYFFLSVCRTCRLLKTHQ